MFKGSYDLIKAIIEKVQLPAHLKMLLIAIANHWSKENPNPFPEYTTLVVEAGIPKRTLPRKLKALKGAGWLDWQSIKGRSNIYKLAVGKIEALSVGSRQSLALPVSSATMALPNEGVAPELGTTVAPQLGARVAPKLGALTNKEQTKEQTIYNKQEVEPSELAGMDGIIDDTEQVDDEVLTHSSSPEPAGSTPIPASTKPMRANEVSPEKEMFHFMEDENGNPCMVFDPFHLMPATRSSLPSNKPSLPAAVEVQAPPPPPPPVAPPPQPSNVVPFQPPPSIEALRAKLPKGCRIKNVGGFEPWVIFPEEHSGAIGYGKTEAEAISLALRNLKVA